MIFTVSWTDRAKAQLADLWNNSADRKEITTAADGIDDMLRRDAHVRGESRFANVRVLHEKPLGVSFRVSEADRSVTVFFVWRF
jgi:hypothetical protein